MQKLGFSNFPQTLEYVCQTFGMFFSGLVDRDAQSSNGMDLCCPQVGVPSDLGINSELEGEDEQLATGIHSAEFQKTNTW